MTRDEVVQIIEKHIAGAESLRALARQWGVSAAYLSDIRLGRRYPGKKVLRKIGLEATINIERTFEATPKGKSPGKTKGA